MENKNMDVLIKGLVLDYNCEYKNGVRLFFLAPS